MKQIVLKFGLLAACLLLLMQLGEYTYIARRLSDEVFFTLFAILFLAFGYMTSRYLHNQQNTKKEAATNTPSEEIKTIDPSKITKLNISKREYQVLELINLGHSNLEISEKLYISESTVKSHVSSLLQKLNAKRRTQAIRTAKELEII